MDADDLAAFLHQAFQIMIVKHSPMKARDMQRADALKISATRSVVHGEGAFILMVLQPRVCLPRRGTDSSIVAVWVPIRWTTWLHSWNLSSRRSR